jgi:hypothetical protein
MSSDRACTIAMTYQNLKSTTDPFDSTFDSVPDDKEDDKGKPIAKESIDHLDRMAGGMKRMRFACTVQS